MFNLPHIIIATFCMYTNQITFIKYNESYSLSMVLVHYCIYLDFQVHMFGTHTFNSCLHNNNNVGCIHLCFVKNHSWHWQIPSIFKALEICSQAYMPLEWLSIIIFMLTMHSTTHGSKQVGLLTFACGWNHTWKFHHTHGNKKVGLHPFVCVVN